MPGRGVGVLFSAGERGCVQPHCASKIVSWNPAATAHVERAAVVLDKAHICQPARFSGSSAMGES